jgi:hypothetical protein
MLSEGVSARTPVGLAQSGLQRREAATEALLATPQDLRAAIPSVSHTACNTGRAALTPMS